MIMEDNSKNSDKKPKDGSAAQQLTPLMQQYMDIKSRYPGMILFFRLGDFYEMFGEDAKVASRILDVVLTKRQEVPMCGIPHHAVNSYLRKLIKAGLKVAVAEQMEEAGAGKKIVRRDVVRIITPGTILEDNLLDSKKNNFLMALLPDAEFKSFGIAFCDISTGHFTAAVIAKDSLQSETFRIKPGEIIVPANYAQDDFFKTVSGRLGVSISPLDEWLFLPAEAQNKIKTFYKLVSLKPFGLENYPLAQGACGALLGYIEKTQKENMPALCPIKFQPFNNYMHLDETAVNNLELVEGLTSRGPQNSLLEAIDSTQTPMGARLLRSWLLKPLLNHGEIIERQKAVSFFLEEGLARRKLRTIITGISDIERILGRLSSGTAGPRELIGLKNSMRALPEVISCLKAEETILPLPDTIEDLKRRLDCPPEIAGAIEEALTPEPPATLKDGGVIKDGFDKNLDELRVLSRDSKKLISEIESSERAKTGISSLKIGYTSVFGYYIEITKSNLHLAPASYIRKQTVAGGERFITEELKNLEGKILTAQERILKLEDELFKRLRQKLLSYCADIQRAAAAVSELDVFIAFAENAALNRYCIPKISDGRDFKIKDGRHPVIEKNLKSGSFVPNDISLDGDSEQIVILTGPNMAGKSTYLRQAALIAVMAQIGSFVPAAEAEVGIIDRIFTRIGASDNLAGGESTFMVEMHETASILNQFTDRSLIILDEIGRGTSTYDGISIARSVVEFFARGRKNGAGAKVLFATHYFELTDLSEKYAGIKNFNVSVREWQGAVLFLHKIAPGAADRSYGIHVAELAGLPKEVIKRANQILAGLEERSVSELPGAAESQPDLFSVPSPKILIELEKIDINNLTPLEALKLLSEWKEKIKKNEG
ncbi:MAG TPA: DNA mismatch repair protein MutS [Elusimicrobia bacterium]|nr:DNA mismatch repair protein MutS [Elusimicrobiota bacterium]